MGATILTVDSSEPRLQARIALLRKAGLRVFAARTGGEALNLAAATEPAVVLLADGVSDIDIVDLCRQLKAQPASASAAVVLLSDRARDDQWRIASMDAGAHVCLAAPFTPDLLLAQVRALARDRRAPRTLSDHPDVPDTSETIKLVDLIDVGAVGSLLNDFYAMTGIPMGIVDNAGNVLVGVGWQRICTAFHRVQPEAALHCRESDTQLCAGIVPGEFRMYKCRNSMWDVATPIMAGDRHVGYVFAGQFFLQDEPPDPEVFRTQARRYGFDERDYLAALDAVPRFPRETVNAGVAFFVRLAHMLSQLGHTNLRLARSMAERDELMDSLRRREAQLRDTAVKLRQANQLKDEFLSTLSHELRTPLMAIVGWSQMLMAGTVAGDAAGRAVEVISRNAQTLCHLIDDILDVSRIVTGKMRLDVRPVDLVPIVGSAVESVRVSADSKGISLVTTFDAAPAIVGDPSRLQQVFWNLLSNAVKFTPPGGRIEVSVRPANSNVEISVTDTGIGIEPAFLPHVFERFSQHDSSTTRTHTGLGLGLAIVREVVDLHGGTVGADSAGGGHGSRFTVTLPIHTALAHVEPERLPRAENGVDGIGPMPDLRGLHVLVVDDEAEAGETLQAALTSAGARVTVAVSAGEALTQLGRAVPDVLVSDIGMPRVDGYELIRTVRGRGLTMPAVAVSGYGRAQDRDRALAAGFDRYLVKPVLPNAFAALVAGLARPQIVRGSGI